MNQESSGQAPRGAITDLVLASNNAGKLKELRAMLGGFSIRVRPLAEFTTSEADEPHATFLENALTKARHSVRITGLPSLADDSGLCVDALGGGPGIHSARYAGEPRSDERNNDFLLDRLAGAGDRRAHYYCVLVLLRHADDPQPLIAEGEWHGQILYERRGRGGFGYDPLFWLPDLACTAAELDAARKNAISHRACAFQTLARRLAAIQSGAPAHQRR